MSSISCARAAKTSPIASSTRADEDPKVFTAIHLDYTVKGKGLAEAKVKRAIELSKEKYCSASIMLGKSAEITYGWKVESEG